LLAEDRRLARVLPRYFDARDQAGAGLELDDGLPHDDCAYFAGVFTKSTEHKM